MRLFLGRKSVLPLWSKIMWRVFYFFYNHLVCPPIKREPFTVFTIFSLSVSPVFVCTPSNINDRGWESQLYCPIDKNLVQAFPRVGFSRSLSLSLSISLCVSLSIRSISDQPFR